MAESVSLDQSGRWGLRCSSRRGAGCFPAAVIPIINSLVPEADRLNVLARRKVLNAAPAAGSLAAGVAIIALWRGRVSRGCSW